MEIITDTYPLLATIAYLVGSIPFGLILTKMAGRGDIRAIGSGNIGATNVLRTGSKKLAAMTLCLDAGKGAAITVLIALSGSGNSPNITKALETANNIGVETFAILAFNGGKCKELAKTAIHFEIDDMQIAEDTQLVVGHLCMQWLSSNKPTELSPLR